MRNFLIIFVTFATSIANAFVVHAQMTQTQFDALRNNLSVYTVALAVDEKCDLLDSVTAEATRIKVSEYRSISSRAGIAGLDEFIKGIQNEVQQKSCLSELSSSTVKMAKQEAEALAGYYLLPWYRLYETHGPLPSGRTTCDQDGPTHEMIREAIEGQIHLIEKVKLRSDYEQNLGQIDQTVAGLKRLCNHSGQYFSNDSHPSIKVLKSATNSMLHASIGSNVGLLKVRKYSPEIIAYRGEYIPEGQIYTVFPWAVFVDGREEIKGGTFEYMTTRSTVQIGFLRDKHFAANIRPPSMANFTVDIFQELRIEAVASKETWVLKTRNTDYKAKRKDAYKAAQYLLPQPQSKEIMDAVLAGNDLHLTVVRYVDGKSYRVEVSTIKAEDLQKAITYAYAPKIVFD